MLSSTGQTALELSQTRVEAVRQLEPAGMRLERKPPLPQHQPGGRAAESSEAGRREPSVAPRPRPRASEEGAGKLSGTERHGFVSAGPSGLGGLVGLQPQQPGAFKDV